MVVYTPTPDATAPCGACRQVIFEFGPEARVVSCCDGNEPVDTTVAALLPGAFGPGNLGKKDAAYGVAGAPAGRRMPVRRAKKAS